MSNVTRLAPFPKMVHVEADIPISQRDKFERAIADILAGERPRMDTLDGYAGWRSRRDQDSGHDGSASKWFTSIWPMVSVICTAGWRST